MENSIKTRKNVNMNYNLDDDLLKLIEDTGKGRGSPR